MFIVWQMQLSLDFKAECREWFSAMNSTTFIVSLNKLTLTPANQSFIISTLHIEYLNVCMCLCVWHNSLKMSISLLVCELWLKQSISNNHIHNLKNTFKQLQHTLKTLLKIILNSSLLSSHQLWGLDSDLQQTLEFHLLTWISPRLRLPYHFQLKMKYFSE